MVVQLHCIGKFQSRSDYQRKTSGKIKLDWIHGMRVAAEGPKPAVGRTTNALEECIS